VEEHTTRPSGRSLLEHLLSTIHVRVSLVEPGEVVTELSSHLREEIRERALRRFAGVQRLEADDPAAAVACIVTRLRRRERDAHPSDRAGESGR
jgi:NADP-dependent 3-hydroxy acid dehydrogenase YdfG